MKALLFAGPKKVVHENVPDPIIQEPDDVVIRVVRTAICGSDLHIYHGRESGLDHGTVMGHEFAGEVVAVGKGVSKFRPGDRVCGPFSINCGACFYCERGLTARCPKGRAFFGWVENGVGLQGAQAEYLRVPLADSTLVKMSDSLEWDEAVLLGDNFSAGFFCADMAEVEPGGVYAVVGCGVVGLVAIIAARERGAEQIIAVDRVPFRLQLAEQFGATTIATPEEGPALVREATDGRGVDAVLEAVGNESAQRLAFDLLRPCGILATVGLHTSAQFSFTPFEAYNKNLVYKTGRCPARRYMELLISVIERHRKNVRKLLSHCMPLSKGAEAYRLFDSKDDHCTKIILDPTS